MAVTNEGNPLIERFDKLTAEQRRIVENDRSVALIRPGRPMIDLNPQANEFFARKGYTAFQYYFYEEKHSLVCLCIRPSSVSCIPLN